MKHIVIMTLTGGLLLSTTFTGEIHERKVRQQDRIAQGVKNGSLTPHETANLERKEGALNQQIRQDRKGGLTPAERRQIDRKQDRLSHDIYTQKHDAQH